MFPFPSKLENRKKTGEKGRKREEEKNGFVKRNRCLYNDNDS